MSTHLTCTVEAATATSPVQLQGRAPGRLKELDRRKTLASFNEWCCEQGRPTLLTMESYSGFELFLRGAYAPGVVKRKLRHLYDLAVSSADPLIRDTFFENFPDCRTSSEILAGRWWPAIPRILVPKLQASEKIRIIRELDNFFRWRERSSGPIAGAGLQMLILSDSISDRTRYQRVSRLCIGLDAVLPGAPELRRLRAWQRVLYERVWPKAPVGGSKARRIAEIEQLVAVKERDGGGAPLSEATLEGYRKVLMLHWSVMAALGRGFEFDRAALDSFAAYMCRKLGLQDGTSPDAPCSASRLASAPEWSDVTAWSMCEKLAPFIPDPGLRAEWQAFVGDLRSRAKKLGQLKRKERSFLQRPLTLAMLFRRASELCERADAEMCVQRRHGLYVVVGALSILLFYPLRRADLLRLRIGHELTLRDGRWLLSLKRTKKTGQPVSPLVLPDEAGTLIEACLLQGSSRAQLPEVYEAAKGRLLLASPRRCGAYAETAFSDLFARWTGHGPHIVRSVWCDNLVAQGADRATIKVMLQHDSLVSQEDYEIIASKIRQTKVIDALRDLALVATGDGEGC